MAFLALAHWTMSVMPNGETSSARDQQKLCARSLYTLTPKKNRHFKEYQHVLGAWGLKKIKSYEKVHQLSLPEHAALENLLCRFSGFISIPSRSKGNEGSEQRVKV